MAGWWFDKAEWSADFCALVLGGWFLLRGWRAGFWEQIGRAATWVVPAIAGLFGIGLAQEHLGPQIPLPDWVETLLFFSLIFWITRKICRRLIDRHLDGVSSGRIDSLMGLGVGACKAILVAWALLYGADSASKKIDWSLPKGSHSVSWLRSLP